MQNIIRYSFFGNFEEFNTNNTENYMKLVNFFCSRGFKSTMGNELQLQPNGEVKPLIMPVFFNEDGVAVEFFSNRINFQMVVTEDIDLYKLTNTFKEKYVEIVNLFITELNIKAIRLALNIELEKVDENKNFGFVTSDFYKEGNITETSLRNLAKVKIKKDLCNVICEKYIPKEGNTIRVIYDINTEVVNPPTIYEGESINKLFEEFIIKAHTIDKGL